MSSLLSRKTEANFQSHYAFRFEEQSLEEDDHNGRHNEGKEPVEGEVKHSYLTSWKHAYNKKDLEFLNYKSKIYIYKKKNKKNLKHSFFLFL